MSTAPKAQAATQGVHEAIPAIRQTVRVACAVERAFHRFTEGIDEWWPLERYSVGQENAASVTFENRVGGRIFETLEDGSEADWGRITAWDPPRRVAFTWHPGRPEETRQEVEVTFHAEGAKTRVELVHAGWERIPGGSRASCRDGYDSGWDVVLARFVEA